MAVTYQQIVENIMNMKCNDNDTMTMLQAAEKIPPQLYDKIVSISPMGIYAPGAPIEKIPQIEYGTAPSGETVTTTTGTSTTNIDSGISITAGGTAAPFVTEMSGCKVDISIVNDPLTLVDASTGDIIFSP